GLQSVGKLHRIWIPVAHAAEPTGIHVEHFESEVGCVTDHACRNSLIHLHAATPAIVNGQRIVWISPCVLAGENATNPAVEDMGRCVGAALGCSDKNRRCFKRFAWLQPRQKRAGLGIETGLATEKFSGTIQGQVSASAELDPNIPTGAFVL